MNWHDWPNVGEEIEVSNKKYEIIERTITENKDKCIILRYKTEEERPPDEANFDRIINIRN